jgi:alpha-beta hydrolase superfamily lysophospholipase
MLTNRVAPMSITSTAEPRPHSVVGSELVRRWDPPSEPVAEVIFVHGIAEHSGRYENLGSALAADGLAMTAPDLIGFGVTGGRRGHVDDWVLYLDQVERHVVDALATGRPVVLMGQSMGALICLEFALSQRPRPDLLVLVSPALSGGKPWQHWLAPLMCRLAGSLRLPNVLAGDQLSRDPAVAEAYFADPLVTTRSSCRLGHEFFTAMDRTSSAIDRLDVPTLVLHGGLDTIVPPTATVDLGAHPQVERRLYPPLRHEILNEPEGPEVMTEISEWIRAQIG